MSIPIMEYIRCYHCGEYAAIMNVLTDIETMVPKTMRRCLVCGVIENEDVIINRIWVW